MREIVRQSDKLMKKIDWDLATNKYEEAFAKIDFGVGKQTSANGGMANMLREFVQTSFPHLNWEEVRRATPQQITAIPEHFFSEADRDFIFQRSVPARQGIAPDVIIFDDPDLNITQQLEF